VSSCGPQGNPKGHHACLEQEHPEAQGIGPPDIQHGQAVGREAGHHGLEGRNPAPCSQQERRHEGEAGAQRLPDPGVGPFLEGIISKGLAEGRWAQGSLRNRGARVKSRGSLGLDWLEFFANTEFYRPDVVTCISVPMAARLPVANGGPASVRADFKFRLSVSGVLLV